MEIIMQYKNRKIYSLKINKYVNNAYLKDLINLNESFKVIEKDTNKDVTYRFRKRLKIEYKPKFLSWTKSFAQEVDEFKHLISQNPEDVNLLKREFYELTGGSYE
jgi:hypothetical protein